jgi:hypothetical protein
MHDGVSLEGLQRPTVVVVTTEFLREAELQRAALGMDALVPAVISHPLSTLTDAEIEARAADVATQAARIWLGR